MFKTIIGLTLATLLALTGCATTDTKDGAAGDKSGTNAPTGETSPATEEETSETPEEDGPLKFGTAKEWEDGLYVRISKPTKYTPSEYAVTGKAPHNLVFTVKIVNGTGKVLDASMFSTSLQSGNTEAEEIFDSANGLKGSPSTKLLDGREAEFRVGYNLTHPNDLVMEVSPSFEHDAALFVS